MIKKLIIHQLSKKIFAALLLYMLEQQKFHHKKIKNILKQSFLIKNDMKFFNEFKIAFLEFCKSF